MSQRLPTANHRDSSANHHKILDLDAVAPALKGSKSASKKVVHCHGVFDLLHIGHIRHLEQAKRMGDILVVTVTPDKFVNKGPSRPIFNQNLRMEALAALDCVDFVALNRWPSAVDTIKLLKPDFYVKGPDYQKAHDDLTGGIISERKAVESVGGKFAATNDITFSSSHLINRHFSTLSPEAIEFLDGFSKRCSIKDLAGYLDRASSLKVLLVGESIIDEYRYCKAIGKSSKEPTLALQHLSTEKFAGGILAVANHLINFCGNVTVLSYLGATNSHDRFIRQSLNPRIKTHFIEKRDAPTIVKRRFIEEYFFSKLLMEYEMNDSPLDKGNNRELCDFLNRHVRDYDLVIVFDFGHGLMSREAIDILARKARFLAVNTQTNAGNQGYHTISIYPRADYICMAEHEFRIDARSRHQDIRDIATNLSRKLRCPNVIVTQGRYGCQAYNRNQGFFTVPAFASQVIDRMGAGDAFLAVTAPCVFQHASIEVAGFIGNVAGAEAVATVGHRSSLQKLSLLKHIETLLK